MNDETRREEVITVAVYPATKKEWKIAVEEDPNADSLSQLVRVAVNRYLHRRDDSSAEMTEELGQELTTISAGQERLEQQLDEIKGQLSDVRDSVQGTAARPEVEELAGDILEILPSESEIDVEPVMSGDFETGVPAPRRGSKEWVANRIDRSSLEVQAALDHLLESMYTVQRTDDGRYYKEV